MDNQIRDISTKNRRKRLLKRAVAFLCVVVMLFTMNTLKRSANTLERIPMCGMSEHTHTPECYSDAGELVCGRQEHAHTDACYQESPSANDADDDLDLAFDDVIDVAGADNAQNLDLSEDLDQGGLLDFVQNANDQDANIDLTVSGGDPLTGTQEKEENDAPKASEESGQELSLEPISEIQAEEAQVKPAGDEQELFIGDGDALLIEDGQELLIEDGQELLIEDEQEQPVEVEQVLPVEDEQEQPVEVEQEQPVEVEQEQPVEVEQVQPVEVEQEQPVEDEQEQPVEEEQEQPAEEEQEQPVEDEQEQPVEEEQEQPAEVEQEQPVEVEQEQPVEVEQEQPVEVEQEQPVEEEQEQPAEEEQEQPVEDEQEQLAEEEQEQPAEEEQEQPVEDEQEQPAEDEQEQPVEEEQEQPVEVEQEQPAEDEQEQPAEVEQEQPVEDEQEQPVEEEQEQPVEDEQEQPVEDEQEQPVEVEQEQPVEDEQEQPVEVEQEQPVEEEQEQPVEDEQEQPVEDEQEQPAEDEQEQPAEDEQEQPAEDEQEQPAEVEQEQPAEEEQEQPVEDEQEQPVEEEQEQPAEDEQEQPAEVEQEQPAEDEQEQPTEEEQEQPVERHYTATVDLSEAETYPISLRGMIANATPAEDYEDAPETTEDMPVGEWSIEFDSGLFEAETTADDVLFTPKADFESAGITVFNGSRYELTLLNCVLGQPKAEAEPDDAQGDIAYPAVHYEQGTRFINVVVDAPEGAFPEGTVMVVEDVEDQDTLDNIEQSVTGDFVKVTSVHAVDISFRYNDAEIEPLLPISVVMSAVDGDAQAETPVVVHVDDSGRTEVVDSESIGTTEASLEMPATVNPTAQAFEADAFSIYGLVGTQTIATNYIDDSGKTWRIRVGYTEEAGLPNGVTLKVTEVDDPSYLAEAEANLESGKRITRARFFDIKFMDGDREVQPNGQVEVTITLADDAGEVETDETPTDVGETDVRAMHFVEQDNEIVRVDTHQAAETGEGVKFDAEGFSVWGVVYTVDFEVEGDQGEITLDFTAFDAATLPGEGAICYNTEDCSIHVALGLLADIVNKEAETGYDIDVNAALVDNYEFDFDKAEMGKADSGIRLADGELVIEADGFVELTEGERLLRVRATGLTALKQALLEAEGVSIEVIEGNVPLGSEASYTAHTDAETAELVENYINNEENGDSEVAGYSAADLKIVRNDETLPVEGQFKVTVDKASLVPEGMKLDKLYHIHRDENDVPVIEELAVEETEDGLGLVFEVANFSDIVAGYTVDFEYNGYTWSFPGLGSYHMAYIMEQIGVTGEIGDVTLECIEGEQIPEALYLEEKEDGWYLTSDCAFDETYELTVVVDDQTYVITVTDDPEEAWTATVKLYDYDGSTSATADELSIITGKSYGIVAIVTDKDTGAVIGMRTGSLDFSDGASATKSCYVGKTIKGMAQDSLGYWQFNQNDFTFDPSAHNVSFRLYEGSKDTYWQGADYNYISGMPDSMTGYQFLAEPNGTVVSGDTVTMNLQRAYDKQYNIRFNVEPADMGISEEDEYYAFVTVQHATSENTYGWTKITIPKGQSTVDFPITTWYNWNGNELPNERFTGNERVTVQLYTTNQKSDGTKDGFASFGALKDSQTKVLVAEGSSINKYNLYYGARTSENVDASHLTKYYDNLYLRAPNGNISKGDIDALLEDATDFGYYTNRYVGHSGDIEATIGADFMDTDFLADFGYSSANVNVNRLKVLKIYTDNQGQPVQKPVEIRLKQNGVVVATKTGTTNAEGKLEVEFDGLNSGEYEIDEVIDGQVVSGQGSAQVTGETIYYNFSINKAHFANNKNVNYFGTIGPNQDLDKLKTMLQKANRVDVVILTDTAKDKARIDAAKETNTTGKQIDVILNGTEGYKKYDIPNDMLRLKQLSDDLASAQSSSTVRIVNVKASEIHEDGFAFEDDGRYIVINIEMDRDTFCPRVVLDGQLLDCDYGQSGKSNSSHVLYNLRHNGTYYDGDVNTSKLGSGVILAPAANAHILGGPFGGTIITDRVNRAGNELHSNNPNQIQTLNATIQNTIGNPTTGSLELRKEFSNTAIKDKVTYFTFEVQLHNADMTKVAGQSFPASGLKKGDSVAFDSAGKAQVLVRAGNSVTIANLPEGTTFTVKEISTPETAHFTLDHYEVNGERSDTGTIVAGDTQKAKVLNTIKTADLTIEKEVAGTTDEDKEFEFTLLLENKTSGEGETEVWEPYPDNFKISIAGGEYQEVSGRQTFCLKAGQKAELQGLKADGTVIRYTATETAVYIDGVRYEITPNNQPVKGYSNNDLVVQNNYTAGDHLVYINKYSAETRVNFVAHKVMQGRDLTEGEFTFELREGSPTGTLIGTAKQNAADGTVTFDDIEYKIEHRAGEAISDSMSGATIKADGTREKVFTYYICEVEDPTKTDVALAEPVEVQVKVVDDTLGNLFVYDMDDNLITEYSEDPTTHRPVLGSHTYTLPVAKNIVNTLKTQQTLQGTKTLTGRDMAEGETFYFNVTETVHNDATDVDENVIVATGEATGGADGEAVNIAFTPIEYKYDPAATYPQIHTYAIAEDNSKLPSDLKQNGQTVYARVTVNYDAMEHALTASAPEYSLDGSAWSGSADLVSFINTQDTIGFTVTKEWYDKTNTAAYAPRTITFSVKREGEDFDLSNVTVEQTNSGVGSFTKLGNTVTLNAGESGWPIVAIRDVLKGTYVVTETAFTGQADGTTVETTYRLNAGAFQAATPNITADGDALVIKNTETDHIDNPAELTLKKIWDSSVPATEKKTVTYELYRVETSGSSASSSGENVFVVMLSGYFGEVCRTTVHYDKVGDSVSVTVTNPAKASTGYTVSNNNGIGGSASGAVAQVNFIVTDDIAEKGLTLFDYNGDASHFTGSKIEVGGTTPLIVTQLTATPTDHATVLAMGGHKVREVELDAAHWESGVTFEVSKGTDSVAYQYYVVEKDGDRYQAQYTKTGDNEITVKNFKDETVSVRVEKTWAPSSTPEPVTLYLLRFTKNGDVTPEPTETETPEPTEPLTGSIRIVQSLTGAGANSSSFTANYVVKKDGNQVSSGSYNNKNGATISDLEPGSYTVEVTGSDTTYNVTTALQSASVSVTADNTVDANVSHELTTQDQQEELSGDKATLTFIVNDDNAGNNWWNVTPSRICEMVNNNWGPECWKDGNKAMRNDNTLRSVSITDCLYVGKTYILDFYTGSGGAAINISGTGLTFGNFNGSIIITIDDANAVITATITEQSSASALSPFQLVFNPFVAYADESGIISGDVSVSGVDYSALDTTGYTLDTSFGKAVTLASPTWEYTFDGLPKASASGQPYYYAMVEGPVSGYTVEYDHDTPVAASALAGGTLVTLKATNTKDEPQTTELSVNKEWVFANGSTAWPEGVTITVTLYKSVGGAEPVSTSQTKQLTAAKSSDTFTDLPLKEDGQNVTYSVRETGVTFTDANNFTTSVSGSTITNTEKKGNLSLTKTVNGTTDTTKEFTFHVSLNARSGGVINGTYATEKQSVAGTQAVTGGTPFTVTLKAGETWRIDGLPVGATWTVTEDNLSGYTFKGVVAEDNKTAIEDGATVKLTATNVYEATTTFQPKVQKTFTNGNFANNSFSFTLTEVDSAESTQAKAGTTPQTVTVNSGTAKAFEAITYDQTIFGEASSRTKTYYYTIAEQLPNGLAAPYIDDNGIQYDPTVHRIQVTVTDNGAGELVKTILLDGNQVEEASVVAAFTNVQLGKLEITKRVEAQRNDDKAGTFWYAVFKAEDVEEVVSGGNTTRQPKSGTHTVRTGSIVVTTDGTETVTEDDLPYGEYYVFELAEAPTTVNDTSENLKIILGGDQVIASKVYTVTGSGTTATVNATAGRATLTNTVPDKYFHFTKEWWISGSSAKQDSWPGSVTIPSFTLERILVYNENGTEHSTTVDSNFSVVFSEVGKEAVDKEPDASSKLDDFTNIRLNRTGTGNDFTYTVSKLPKYGSMTDNGTVRVGEWKYRVKEAQVSGYNAPVYLTSNRENLNNQYAEDEGIIQNYMITVALPATGGVGTGVVYGAGAALLLLAVLGLVLLNRKRSDGQGIR